MVVHCPGANAKEIGKEYLVLAPLKTLKNSSPTPCAQNRAHVSTELELLARGLLPPPSLNCSGARGEGSLTEAAGVGGAPAAEAATALGTAGQITHSGVSQL